MKRKLFTKNGVDSSCSSCHKTITSESGRGLRFDGCNNAFYEKCIPKHHKEHIPISEDVDEFLCHMCYRVELSESSRPRKKKKWEEEESDYDEYEYDDDDDDDDDIHELALQINKSKIDALVSEHYSTMNGSVYTL